MTSATSLVNRFIHKYGRLPTEYDPDYLEMLRMSKYRTVVFPDVNPAKCANCGAAKEDGRKYIDFGLHVDWYGCVFLCSECLTDLSRALGLFRAFEVKILQLEEKLAEYNTLKITGADLQSTVLKTFEEVKTYFDNLSASQHGDVSNSGSRVESDEKSGESGISKTESGAKKPESRSAKSTTVPGSKNVPRLEDLLNT